MLKDCLMRDYESLGIDWCEEVFDSKNSKEPSGTAAVPMSWYLRITQRKAKFWRARGCPTAILIRFATAGITPTLRLHCLCFPCPCPGAKAFFTGWPKQNKSAHKTNTAHYSVSIKLCHKHVNDRRMLPQVFTELMVRNQHPEGIPSQVFLSTYQASDMRDWV